VQIRRTDHTAGGVRGLLRGPVLKPTAGQPHSLCASIFGPDGSVPSAKKMNPKNHGRYPAGLFYDDTVTGCMVTGFPAFGRLRVSGSLRQTVQRVSGLQRWWLRSARFESTKPLFANNIRRSVGTSEEAASTFGDSPKPKRGPRS